MNSLRSVSTAIGSIQMFRISSEDFIRQRFFNSNNSGFENSFKNLQSRFSDLKLGRCTDFEADDHHVVKTPFKDGCFDVIGSRNYLIKVQTYSDQAIMLSIIFACIFGALSLGISLTTTLRPKLFDRLRRNTVPTHKKKAETHIQSIKVAE